MKTKEEIQAMLNETVNKLIAAHSGGITVVSRDGVTVEVNMVGGCQGCAGAKYTLNLYVTEAIKEFDSTVEWVIDVTDHDKGANPYYIKE